MTGLPLPGTDWHTPKTELRGGSRCDAPGHSDCSALGEPKTAP
jgi:hypothetical protein